MQDTIANWHQETFPDVSLEMQVNKMLEEAVELSEAKNSDEFIEEFADVVIAGTALLSMMGLNLTDVVADKMSVNRLRTWSQDGSRDK